MSYRYPFNTYDKKCGAEKSYLLAGFWPGTYIIKIQQLRIICFSCNNSKNHINLLIEIKGNTTYNYF